VERERRGKPPHATLTLSAAATGQFVEIHVMDDGRGIDLKAVRARAAAAGIPLTDEPTDAELLAVICRSGFSTREEADRSAGRGVGMAVVLNTVRELSGSLALENRPGRGTRFTLRLPLTLSITETFLVSAANQLCAVPQAFIEEVIEITPDQIRTIQKTEIISYREGVLPLVRLRRMFQAEDTTAAQLPVLVLGSEAGSYGLVVDKINGRREVVVHAIRDPLVRVPGVSGASELGDGRPVLILDALALSNGAVRPRNGELRPGREHRSVASPSLALSSS
jgi:two-component system chemotaxis sensor kinase CheA